MAFLTGYFDESGKHDKTRIVSFCGLVNADWSGFEAEWAALLRRYQMPALHVGAKRVSSDELDMYRRFIQVILRTVEHGFAIAVDGETFASTTTLHGAFTNDPHYAAFSTVLLDLTKFASVLPEPSIALVCDDDPKKACDIYGLFSRYRQRNVESWKVLRSIAFADDRFYMQLQAADLFAWVTRFEAAHRFCGEPFTLRELHSEFNLQFPARVFQPTSGFWDADSLRRYERMSKKDIAGLRR